MKFVNLLFSRFLFLFCPLAIDIVVVNIFLFIAF